MSSYLWKVAGVTALVLLGFIALSCVDGNTPFRECLRLNMQGVVVAGLRFGAIALGAWLGVECASATRRAWLGWIVGIALVVGMLTLLEWIGFTSPEYPEYIDN